MEEARAGVHADGISARRLRPPDLLCSGEMIYAISLSNRLWMSLLCKPRVPFANFEMRLMKGSERGAPGCVNAAGKVRHKQSGKH